MQLISLKLTAKKKRRGEPETAYRPDRQAQVFVSLNLTKHQCVRLNLHFTHGERNWCFPIPLQALASMTAKIAILKKSLGLPIPRMCKNKMIIDPQIPAYMQNRFYVDVEAIKQFAEYVKAHPEMIEKRKQLMLIAVAGKKRFKNSESGSQKEVSNGTV